MPDDKEAENADNNDGGKAAADDGPSDLLPIGVGLGPDRRLLCKHGRACLEVGNQSEKLTARLGRHCL